MVGRGQSSSAWGILCWEKRQPQEPGCRMSLGGSLEPPSWILGGLQTYLLEHFAQIKASMPPARCSESEPTCPLSALSLHSHPQPCEVVTRDTLISASQSIHRSLSVGKPSSALGWGVGWWTIGLGTNLGNGDNWRVEDAWLRLHILTLYLSNTAPAPGTLHPHSHLQSPARTLPPCLHSARVLASHTWP